MFTWIRYHEELLCYIMLSMDLALYIALIWVLTKRQKREKQ